MSITITISITIIMIMIVIVVIIIIATLTRITFSAHDELGTFAVCCFATILL